MRSYSIIFLLVLACCSAPSRSFAAEPTKPNIIFILADDLGYGDLGCYGQTRIKTPHLDRLAAEGMRFTSCYAGSTVCAPSRSVLMTGLHTGHTRIRGNARHPLEPGDVTVAEVLKKHGYATGLVGKWGLGEAGSTGAPTRQGFDHFFGYFNQRHAHNYFPTHLWRNEEKVLLKNVVSDEDEEGSGVASVKAEYSPYLFEKEALQFIRDNQRGPFFLYFASTLPHANNEAKDKGLEIPSDGPYAGQDWPAQEKSKAAMISLLDEQTGKMMALLKELGLDEKTIIFFSSDNGSHREGGAEPSFHKSSGPLRGIKRDLYEGGIRVPGLVRWPGRVRAGSVSDQPWAFWDFLPTAAELAAGHAGTRTRGGDDALRPQDYGINQLDGISIAPHLLGKQAELPERFFYWEFHERGFKQAARRGDWKAVKPGLGQPIELYNLKTDLAEKNNLADKHPDRVEEFAQFFKTARTESKLWPVNAPRSQN